MKPVRVFFNMFLLAFWGFDGALTFNIISIKSHYFTQS